MKLCLWFRFVWKWKGKSSSFFFFSCKNASANSTFLFHPAVTLDWFFYLCSTWLWNAARGISGDEVESRLLPKSHGSGKTFPGPRALKTSASVSISIKTMVLNFVSLHFQFAEWYMNTHTFHFFHLLLCLSLQVQKWLNELCEELSERLLSDLEQNKRIAHTLSLHVNAYKVFCLPKNSCSNIPSWTHSVFTFDNIHICNF